MKQNKVLNFFFAYWYEIVINNYLLTNFEGSGAPYRIYKKHLLDYLLCFKCRKHQTDWDKKKYTFIS